MSAAAPTLLPAVPQPAHRPPRRPPADGCSYIDPAGQRCDRRGWVWSPRDGLYFCSQCFMPEPQDPAPQPITPPRACLSCARPGAWSGRGAWWYCPSCGSYIGSPLD